MNDIHVLHRPAVDFSSKRDKARIVARDRFGARRRQHPPERRRGAANGIDAAATLRFGPWVSLYNALSYNHHPSRSDARTVRGAPG